MKSPKENLRAAIYRAKLAAYMTGSHDPKKMETIELLRTVMDEAQRICEIIIGGEE